MLRERVAASIARVPEDQDVRESVAASIRSYLTAELGVSPTFAAALEQRVRAVPTGTGDAARTAVAAAMVESFEGAYTPEQLTSLFATVERRTRHEIITQKGWTALTEDEVVAYGVSGATAHLHLQPARTLPPGGLLRAFRAAMHSLATRLRAGGDLAAVERISVVSEIVEEHPRIFARMGFTLDADALPTEERVRIFGSASVRARHGEMPVEELLRRDEETRSSD